MRLLYDSKNNIERSPLPDGQVAGPKRMDDKEFRRKLSEVAEWIIPENVENPSRPKRKRRKKTDEQLVELVEEDRDGSEEQESEPEPTGPNTTIPIHLVRLKLQGCQCEDCGQWCPQGRHTERKRYETGKTHWRTRCVTCNKIQHPVSGEFSLTPQESSMIYTNLMRETKGVYVSKYNSLKIKAEISSEE